MTFMYISYNHHFSSLYLCCHVNRTRWYLFQYIYIAQILYFLLHYVCFPAVSVTATLSVEQPGKILVHNCSTASRKQCASAFKYSMFNNLA